MKILITLSVFFLFTFSNLHSQNVLVNPGAGSYPTLKAAFDAINAGTHIGTVTVDILNNTTETATAIIQRSGTGSSNYLSVTVRPSGGPRTIQGNINGAIIKIDFAENVSIDGRISGEGRNLIIKNNNAGFSFTSCVWVASSGIGTALGSRHITVRNCELNCGVNQLASNLITYGIVQSGISTDINAFGGANNDSNFYHNNKIYKCNIGIALLAYTTNLNQSNVINGNLFGSTSYNSDIIGKAGIYSQNQEYCEISNNEVMFIGGTRTVYTFGTDLIGIAVEKLGWDNSSTTSNIGKNYKVLSNKVHDIKMENGFSAAGFVVASSSPITSTNNLIANNEIYNVLCNGNSNRQLVGIGKISGTNDMIVYNSIYLSGDADPPGNAAALDTTGGGIIIRSATANDSATLVANNSIYINITQNRDSIRTRSKYCIVAPLPGYNWGTGGIKNNDYYFPPANTKMKTGGTGISTGVTVYSTLANWQTAYSPGQDVSSIQSNPAYAFSPSNYLIPLPSSALLLNAIPLSSVTTDILGVARSVINPTIGAYEKDSAFLSTIFLNFSGYIQGFYNDVSNLQVSDTIKVYLRNILTPFSSVDSSKAVLSTGGTATLTFNNTPDGTYYIVFTHRNSLQTWSKSGGQLFTKGAANNYSFKDLSSKAYADNLIQVDPSPSTFGFYSGDVNQDGFIDLVDVVLVFNSASAFEMGYILTDLNGDLVTDLSDLIIAFNNSANFVKVEKP